MRSSDLSSDVCSSDLEDLGTDAFALARGRIEVHHVGNMDRRLALDHAARLVGLRIRLGVALDDVDVRHDDLVAHDAHHVALLALVLAGGDDHAVTLLDTVHIFLSSIRGSVASPRLYSEARRGGK